MLVKHLRILVLVAPRRRDLFESSVTYLAEAHPRRAPENSVPFPALNSRCKRPWLPVAVPIVEASNAPFKGRRVYQKRAPGRPTKTSQSCVFETGPTINLGHRERVAATLRLRRGSSRMRSRCNHWVAAVPWRCRDSGASRGDAAATTWIFRGRADVARFDFKRMGTPPTKTRDPPGCLLRGAGRAGLACASTKTPRLDVDGSAT